MDSVAAQVIPELGCTLQPRFHHDVLKGDRTFYGIWIPKKKKEAVVAGSDLPQYLRRAVAFSKPGAASTDYQFQ